MRIVRGKCATLLCISVVASFSQWLSAQTSTHFSVIDVVSSTAQAAVQTWAYTFPNDHFVHLDSATELWRLLGTYKSQDDLLYALTGQVLRARVVNQSTPRQDSQWRFRQIFGMSQSVVNLQSKTLTANVSVAREALRLAEFDSAQGQIWVNQHSLRILSKAHCRLDAAWLFSHPESTLRLDLQQLNCPIFRQSDTPQPFHNYAQPMQVTSGQFGDHRIVDGRVWLIHGWGGLPQQQSPVVVDQFFLPISEETLLTMLRTRRADGTGTAVLSAEIYSDGQVHSLDYRTIGLSDNTHWRSEKTNISYSVGWTMTWPGHSADIRAVLPNQELDVFGQSRWSGALEVRVSPKHTVGDAAMPLPADGRLYGFAEISPSHLEIE